MHVPIIHYFSLAPVIQSVRLISNCVVGMDDLAKKRNRDVPEVLIDLDDVGARLVIGLRVTVQFLAQ